MYVSVSKERKICDSYLFSKLASYKRKRLAGIYDCLFDKSSTN